MKVTYRSNLNEQGIHICILCKKPASLWCINNTRDSKGRRLYDAGSFQNPFFPFCESCFSHFSHIRERIDLLFPFTEHYKKYAVQ